MQLPLFNNCPVNAAYRVPHYWIEDEKEEAESAPGSMTAREARRLNDQQVEVI